MIPVPLLTKSDCRGTKIEVIRLGPHWTCNGYGILGLGKQALGPTSQWKIFLTVVEHSAIIADAWCNPYWSKMTERRRRGPLYRVTIKVDSNLLR